MRSNRSEYYIILKDINIYNLLWSSFFNFNFKRNKEKNFFNNIIFLFNF